MEQEALTVLAFGRGCGDATSLHTCFASKRVAGLAAGWKHSAIASAAGDVYVWGWGHGIVDDCDEPRLVKSLALHRALGHIRFTQVACGGDFSVAVSENGTAWSWGGNSEGQCGVGPDDNTAVPRIMLGLCRVRVAQVACGGAHCLARTDVGSVFAWGRGAHGCLGLGEASSRNAPTRVKVACGWSHSLCLDSGGKLWTFGKGTEGQLGLGANNKADSLVPQAVVFFLSPPMMVVSASGGMSHSAVLAGPRRELFTFGAGPHGQLGHGDMEDANDPRVVEALLGHRLDSVACGGFHTLAVSEEGLCFSWGDGEYGQLGSVEVELSDCGGAVATPRVIKSLEKFRVKNIAAGCWHSLVAAVPEAAVGSAALSHVSSRETLAMSEDEDMRSLTSALAASLAPGLITAPAPGVVTVQGLFVSKPQPAADTSMRVTKLSPRPHQGSSSLNVDGGSDSGRPISRVGSFLQNLFNLESEVTDAAGPEGLRESQRAAAMEKAVAIWRKDVIPDLVGLRRRGKLTALVMKGIPAAVRGQVWLLLIGNEQGITHAVWEDATMRAAQERSRETRRLIAVDLPRTFPKLQLFQENGPMHNDLTEVLEAFAVHRSDLGYVQGMSFVGAMLMLHMNAFDAFVCLCNMLTSHFFVSLYQFNIRECLKHIRIYELLFSKHLPSLFSHFVKLGVSPEHYLLDFFFTIFSRSLPLGVSVRVWDCFLLEGQVFLFRTALALLKMYEGELLKSSLEQIVPLLRKLPEDVTEARLFAALDDITVPRYIHQFIDRIVAGAAKDVV